MTMRRTAATLCLGLALAASEPARAGAVPVNIDEAARRAPSAQTNADHGRYAPLRAYDSLGRAVCLREPARRVVTLAPHATELLLLAGGAATLAGTVAGPQLPPPPEGVAAVGDAQRVNPEALARLRPDLVIAWMPLFGGPQQQSDAGQAADSEDMPTGCIPGPDLPGRGNSSHVVQRVLQVTRAAVFYSRPGRLDDIPAQIEALGTLLGTDAQARAAAAALRERLQQLRRTHAQQPRLRVFVHAGQDPLYTLNGEHILSDALDTCGADNVFAHLPVPAPMVGVESVLQARPDLIVAGRSTSGFPDVRAYWSRFANALPAARAGNIVLVDEDLLYRPGPRLIEATHQLCTAFARFRAGENSLRNQ